MYMNSRIMNSSSKFYFQQDTTMEQYQEKKLCKFKLTHWNIAAFVSGHGIAGIIVIIIINEWDGVLISKQLPVPQPDGMSTVVTHLFDLS